MFMQIIQGDAAPTDGGTMGVFGFKCAKSLKRVSSSSSKWDKNVFLKIYTQSFYVS